MDFLEIKPSPIHGNGLFAKVDIPTNTKLSYFEGIEMSRKDFKDKYGDDWRGVYQRMPWMTVIVGKDYPNLIKYVNDGHYNHPHPHHNCVVKSRWLINIEPIKKGTELTLKYPRNYHFNLG